MKDIKSKHSPIGQYILEGIGDIDEDPYSYVEELLPLIGEVTVLFNALESDLDHVLCMEISDRSDHKGLLVLHQMMYSKKVELYGRFRSEMIRELDWEGMDFDAVLADLKECARLRNQIVHANWQYTDTSGYTHVKFKMSKKGLSHELVQFTVEALNSVIEKIDTTRTALEYTEEEVSSRLHAL